MMKHLKKEERIKLNRHNILTPKKPSSIKKAELHSGFQTDGYSGKIALVQQKRDKSSFLLFNTLP